ncbi:adenylate cyclase [Jatrophihabitans endophyticus]|uniref:Adenylate cyclase n=1 Tax=Jatrophihabitans endophyticus TaxID=1206085 RepID=A0A1M5G681_9ACTN|nr:adenylate/guanylate cyclase domain-containing protein [Jatrophihabitans endophyticus]SHF98942.1 adenylate cyclase [Jatrophihabitans endophyticus]
MTTPADGPPDGAAGRPIDVAHVAANVPLVVRTAGGIALLGIGLNVIGVVVVALLVTAMNTSVPDDQLRVLFTTTIVLTAASVVCGVTLATLVQRRTLRWLLRGEAPGADDARRALRMPLDLAVITAGLWTIGAVVMATVAGVVGTGTQRAAGLAGGLVVAGFVSAGLMYLVLGRFNQPVRRLALAASPPRTAPLLGVRWQLLINWVLTSGLPLVGVALVLTAPPGQRNKVGVSLVVVAIAILVGVVSTGLIARAIGAPLRSVVDALRRVGDGRLDLDLPIEDAGEIGLLQNGFNEMVAGLRERDRVTDLFGRHVGPAVAAEAISSGVTLSGEGREVVALFVDITGSTALTRTTAPADFVAMLNRFFEVVVDEVEGNGGLLNKFEGDAALCVFGAPAEVDEPAAAALRTARGIRDRVALMGELEIGIGVASGPVVAGQIGAASRLEYTVVGDAVNEASRLTDLAKRTDGRILASATTVEAADPDERGHWTKGRAMRLRGHDAPVETYRCTDGPRPATPSLVRRLGDVAKAVSELPPRPPHLPGARRG